MEAQEILAMTVVLLRAKLSELNLPIGGRKPELRNRLLEHFNLIDDEDDDDEEGEVEVQDEGEEEGVEVREDSEEGSLVSRVRERFSKFTLKDVKDSLSNFEGLEYPKVKDWIREFEETAETVNWNELQKFVYAKQLLRGAAKSYVRGQNIKNWATLKEKLLSEFKASVSAIEVHNALKRRRKKTEETLREYLYALVEIGKPISMDEESILRYFADGVADTKLNKTIFYQAKTMKELKEAIKVYEAINKEHSQQGKTGIKSGKPNHTNDHNGNNWKCFKCGEASHIARDCKSSTIKCFKCNKLGHKSYECSGDRQGGNIAKINSMHETETSSESRLIFKKICVNGSPVSPLLDTGCDLNLMRYDTLMEIGDAELMAEQKLIWGVKDSKFHTLGSFHTVIEVDDMTCGIKFHVVRERDLNLTVVLGSEMLKTVNMLIKENGSKFLTKEKIEPAKGGDNDADIHHVFHALCSAEQGAPDEAVDLQLDHMGREEATRIQEMVNSKYIV